MNGSAVMGYGGGIGISASTRGDDSVVVARRFRIIFHFSKFFSN